MKVLVSDQIAEEGIRILGQYATVDIQLELSPEDLQSIIKNYDGLVVRSQTKVTNSIIDSADKLRVIGRVGVGVDNIDVDSATRHGIVVVNSPEGNIISTAEHTIAMLLSLVRHIPQAHGQLHSGVWNRSFKGVQVRNKLMGIVGLGRVGSEVADMAQGLHMDIIAYDPMVSESRADKLGIQMVSLDDLLARADFITVHVPLSPATRGLIGSEQLKLMKPTTMIINCARGGIVDEVALYEALERRQVAGAAIDVFSEEPAANNILLKSDKVITTPHLAASTVEAEKSAGIDIADQVAAVLRGDQPKSPVNIPKIPAEAMSTVTGHIQVGITIGNIAAQLMEGQLQSLTFIYQGDIVQEDTTPIKIAVLTGLLEHLTEERVNMVNADTIAKSRGLLVREQKDSTCENYSSMLTVVLETKFGSTQVAGALLRGKPHLIRVNDFWLEIKPTGSYMLFTEHKDRPGMIGAVGTIIGDTGINISQMQVGRGVQRGGAAMMVICLDNRLTQECHEQIKAIPDMNKVLIVKLSE